MGQHHCQWLELSDQLKALKSEPTMPYMAILSILLVLRAQQGIWNRVGAH